MYNFSFIPMEESYILGKTKGKLEKQKNKNGEGVSEKRLDER